MIIKEQLANILKKLVLKIEKEIKEGLSSGVLQLGDELYVRREIGGFEYTENGPEAFAIIGRPFIKKTWHIASHVVEDSIRESDEYSTALEFLTKNSEEKDETKKKFELFTKRIIYEYLSESNFCEAEVVSIITNFLKDLNEEPHKNRVVVELDGIVVLPRVVKIEVGDMKISLRQTRIEDVEKEFPEYVYNFLSDWEMPFAILDIEFLGRAGEAQMKISQAIAILRLFKVGNIKYNLYYEYSYIADPIAPTIFLNLESEKVLEKYIIKEEDVEGLKKFWQIIHGPLSRSIYNIEEIRSDHITIAYNRYCDALFQNNALERRIANSVMGLESLFLKSGETQELSYRLRIRIAKLLSHLGYDPYKVKEVLKVGYGIRSSFVHGGYLSSEEERKLDAKYGDNGNFLLLFLDYLRTSIITMILVKEEKNDFLNMIEDSLIDKKIDEQLNNLLDTVRNIL